MVVAQIHRLLDQATVASGPARLALLSQAGELLRPLPCNEPRVCEARCRRAALVLRVTDHRLPPLGPRPQTFTAPHPLIPAEELTRLNNTVDEALELAGAGQRESGRQKLRHGLRESRAWKGEQWGHALARYWLWALRQYDALTP